MAARTPAGAAEQRPDGGASSSERPGDALPEKAEPLLRELAERLGAAELDVAGTRAALAGLAALLRNAPPAQLQALRRRPELARLGERLAAAASPAADPAVLEGLLQACARLQLKLPREALAALGAGLAASIASATPAQAVRCAWALSHLGFCPPALLGAIEEQALEADAGSGGSSGGWLQGVEPSGLASLLWVCKRASYNSRPLLAALLEAMAAQFAAAAAGSSGACAGAGGAAEGGEDSWEAHARARQVSQALYSTTSVKYTPPRVRLICPSFF